MIGGATGDTADQETGGQHHVQGAGHHAGELLRPGPGAGRHAQEVQPGELSASYMSRESIFCFIVTFSMILSTALSLQS